MRRKKTLDNEDVQKVCGESHGASYSPLSGTQACSAKWLRSEARCLSDAGHTGEHFAKADILYPDGQVGQIEIVWLSGEEATD